MELRNIDLRKADFSAITPFATGPLEQGETVYIDPLLPNGPEAAESAYLQIFIDDNRTGLELRRRQLVRAWERYTTEKPDGLGYTLSGEEYIAALRAANRMKVWGIVLDRIIFDHMIDAEFPERKLAAE